jgi:hypothetical protein
VVAVVAAVIAALVHAWFFLLESVWFMRPSVFARFGRAAAIPVAPALVAVLGELFLGVVGG